MEPEGAGGPDHPDPHALERFLLGELPHAETKSVTAHLMRGCPDCRRRMAPLAAALFGRTGDRLHLAGEAVIGYDGAISRAFRDAEGLRAAESAEDFEPDPWLALDELDEAPRTTAVGRDRERCEALLERCLELRRRDPDAGVLTATLAIDLADRIASGPAGASREVIDLKARCWAELGTTLRLAADLPGAEAALARSLEIAAAGSGDPLLLARQMDLSAALLHDRERGEEADALLTSVREIYELMGSDQAAARALICRGIDAGVPPAAEPGPRRIDPWSEPGPALTSLHSLVWCLVDYGDLTLARRLFAITRDLHDRAGSQVELRTRWLEGRILAGLGDDDAAEAALRRVCGELAAQRQTLDAALATLDLAEVLLRRGLLDEIEELLEQAGDDFEDPATASLLDGLRVASAEESLTAQHLRSAARDLRREVEAAH